MKKTFIKLYNLGKPLKKRYLKIFEDHPEIQQSDIQEIIIKFSMAAILIIAIS